MDLGKIEMAVLNGTMPLAKYYLVHWGSSITDEKKAVALSWLKDQWPLAFGDDTD